MIGAGFSAHARGDGESPAAGEALTAVTPTGDFEGGRHVMSAGQRKSRAEEEEPEELTHVTYTATNTGRCPLLHGAPFHAIACRSQASAMTLSVHQDDRDSRARVPNVRKRAGCRQLAGRYKWQPQLFSRGARLQPGSACSGDYDCKSAHFVLLRGRRAIPTALFKLAAAAGSPCT